MPRLVRGIVFIEDGFFIPLATMMHSTFKVRAVFLLAWALALLLGLLVYLPGLPGAFLFDDIGNIVGNPALSMHPISADSLLRAVLSGPLGGTARPISMLSFALDDTLFGMSPTAFKLTNIFIHICCGAVLYFVGRELLRAYVRLTGAKIDDQTVGWLSLAAMTIWLVHPLNLTSVLYTVQRETSLAALFSAAAILAYLTGRRRELEANKGHLLIWLLTPAFALLGLMCKENAALIPCYLLVTEVVLLHFRGATDHRSRNAQFFFVVFLVLPILAAVALLLSGVPFPSFAGRDFTMFQRLLSESRILLDYLRWIFVPDIQQLSLFHDDIPPSLDILHPATTLPSTIALILLLSSAVAFRKRAPLFSFGVLWFFTGHLMESTILPLELTYEHRNYLPMFGLLLAVVGGLYSLTTQYRYAVHAIFATVVIIFAGATALRAFEWQTEISYAAAETAHHPHSPRAWSELSWAYILYIVSTNDRTAVASAVRAAERSKFEDPHSINQDISLAYMFAKLRDLDQAASYLDAAAVSARNTSPSATTEGALASLLIISVPEDARLYPHVDAILRNAAENGAFSRKGCMLAEVWNTYALFKEQTGDFLTGLGMLHNAVSLCPNNGQMRVNFAQMLLRYQDTRDAQVQLQALRDIHSPRYQWRLRELEQELARQTSPQSRP